MRLLLFLSFWGASRSRAQDILSIPNPAPCSANAISLNTDEAATNVASAFTITSPIQLNNLTQWLRFPAVFPLSQALGAVTFAIYSDAGPFLNPLTPCQLITPSPAPWSPPDPNPYQPNAACAPLWIADTPLTALTTNGDATLVAASFASSPLLPGANYWVVVTTQLSGPFADVCGVDTSGAGAIQNSGASYALQPYWYSGDRVSWTQAGALMMGFGLDAAAPTPSPSMTVTPSATFTPASTITGSGTGTGTGTGTPTPARTPSETVTPTRSPSGSKSGVQVGHRDHLGDRV
jgi:hypothetical protein